MRLPVRWGASDHNSAAQSPWLLRGFGILVVLAASAGIGRLAVVGNHDTIPVYVLAAAGACLALSLLHRLGRFEWGILLVPLAAGLLNFITLPTGTQSRLVISLLISFGLIGFWLLQWVTVSGRVRLMPSPVNAPVIVFVVISAVSYVWSSLLRDPLVVVFPSFPAVQVAALAVNISLPLLLLLVSNKILDMRWLRRLTWIMVGLGALAVASFLFRLPSAAMIDNGSRGIFPAWVGALVSAQALFNRKLAKWQRAGLLGLLAALLYYYFIQIPSWFSGWFPLGVGLGVVLLRRSKKLFLCGLLIGAAYLAAHPGFIQQNIISVAQAKGDFQRLELWQYNLELISQHPLLGVGPAGYAPYYMTYHPQDARSTHNNYFDVLAQTGVAGFLAFLWLFGALLLITLNNCRRLARQGGFGEAFATATLAGCVATLAAMMLGDWALPFAYNQTITGFDNASFTWILLGAAVSLRHILNARASAAPESQEPLAQS